MGGHRTDAGRVLARVRPFVVRRRRRLAIAVTALVAVAAISAAWWAGRSDSRASWGGLSWQTPTGWSVHDPDAGGCRYPPDALAAGPFVGTVETGPMYRRTATGWECGRPLAVRRLPADGVIAWISTGGLSLIASDNADPGPQVAGLCGGTRAGQVFHAYRTFGNASDGARVAIDGCVFGPHSPVYTAQLQAMSDSLRYPATRPQASSPTP
jgi:hypothetical protein